MKCPFCLSDTKNSKEHLLSRPICAAVGINRSTTLVASLDGRTSQIGHAGSLDHRSIRLPCSACNSGWMSDLERDAARTIRRWLSKPDQRLTNAGVVHVTRWLVKTAIVLSFADNDARRFFDHPTDAAIPDIRSAQHIADGRVPEFAVAGAARTNNSTYLWGVGNPTVKPSGPDRISCRAVNVAGLNLGPLQLWVAIPIVPPDKLHLPRGVVALHPQLRSRGLRTRSGNLDPTQVVARYSD
jgi:hypothetical protein